MFCFVWEYRRNGPGISTIFDNQSNASSLICYIAHPFIGLNLTTLIKFDDHKKLWSFSLFLLWYASCCICIRQYFHRSVYTTTFIIKQNRLSVAIFVFYFAWVVIPLHVVTLLLGHPQAYAIPASVTVSIWIHIVYIVINFAILIRLKCNGHCQYLLKYLKLV
jgi:hypothetical protein